VKGLRMVRVLFMLFPVLQVRFIGGPGPRVIFSNTGK
jgi:hypothetical protein